MKRALAAALAALAALSLSLLAAPTPAGAGSAHFHSTTSAVDSSGALQVSWDQRGLGNLNVDYALTADATALYACLNGGGHHPQAANKESVAAQVTAGASFEPKNGRVVASLTAGPLPAPDFTCPSGQTRVLAGVSYSSITLTDTTNGVTATPPDAERTFFDVN